jgi:hypothetical protein
MTSTKFVACACFAALLSSPTGQAAWSAITGISGTLEVLIPYKDGIILAADSRLTIWTADRNEFCDGDKIFVGPNNTAFAISGDAEILVPQPPPEVTDRCRYIKTTTPVIDIVTSVQRFLQANDKSLLELDLKPLSQSFADKATVVAANSPTFRKGFAGRHLFTVAIASYLPNEHESVITQIVVDLGQNGIATARAGPTRFYLPEHLVGYRTFGETEYVDERVTGANMSPFYDPNYWKRLDGVKVQDVSRDQAAAFARHLIDATSKTTRNIPAHSGIGGPINVFAIGSGGAEKLQ